MDIYIYFYTYKICQISIFFKKYICERNSSYRSSTSKLFYMVFTPKMQITFTGLASMLHSRYRSVGLLGYIRYYPMFTRSSKLPGLVKYCNRLPHLQDQTFSCSIKIQMFISRPILLYGVTRCLVIRQLIAFIL